MQSTHVAEACARMCDLQVAYNAIFNPALPKNANGDGLPMMLRNVKGVTDFRLRFLQDKQGIFKTTQVSARLSGVPFEIECRSCSYCGSCFSGRFMELDSTHQRAGGWKEITDKIHAGNYSWKGLKGYAPPCALERGVVGTASRCCLYGNVCVARSLRQCLYFDSGCVVGSQLEAMCAVFHQLWPKGYDGKYESIEHRKGVLPALSTPPHVVEL